MRILLVEDDELLAAGIRDALERALYAVEWVPDGPQALAALQASSFELVILDLGLPGLDGMEVLRRLRGGGGATPVLVLSARDAANDRVLGLDAGADDYLIKPFDLDELLARTRAQQRRLRGAAVNVIEHGRLRLDPAALAVTYEGRPVPLQRREFMLLLKLLAERRAGAQPRAARGVHLRLGRQRREQHASTCTSTSCAGSSIPR